MGGPLLSSTTWGVSGSPYIVYQQVTIPSGVTLTIEPGVVVRFAGPYGIAVTGILGAQGTAGNPISFTSGQASPSPGNWTSIRLSGAESSASQLSHCTIGYADSGLILDSSSATVSYVTSSNNGSNGFVVTNANPTLTGITASSNPTGLYLQSSSPTITQATLSSNFYGAYLLYGSSPTISFSSIVNNSSMGIIVDPGGTSPAPTVNRSSLYGNGNYAVYLYGAANSSAVLDFTENWWGTTNTTAINGSIRDHYDDPNAAYIDYIPFLASAGGDPVTDSFVGGPILTSTTWGVSGSPFTVYQSVTVPSGVTLTIEPGVVVRFAGPYGIAVTGILGARGTAGNPISFTSGQASPSPGNWTSIRLSGAESSASQLSHCTIGYADSGLILDSSSATVSYVTSSNNGSNGFVVTNANPTLTGITASSNPTGLYLQSSSPTITQATLSSNFYGAYLLYGSSPTISFSSIVNNSSMGIIVDPGGTSPAPTVNRSSLYGNGNYAVYLYGAANSSAVLDFTENWWGTTNTTAINGSIRDHYDDPNAAYIDYIPFLASAGGDPVTDSFVGGPILTSTTWGVSGSPFTVYQSVTVPSGVTLTIEPGVVVRFAGPYGIAVTGILGAQGTAGNPISFTSGQASPSPGNWTSIRLSGAESSASQLSHCTIGYADSGLILDSSSATVSYVTSSNNGSNGFVVTNANPTLTGITASSNPTGLYLQSSSPTITQATLSSNFYGAYLLYGSSPTISFSSIVNNSSMGIIVDPGGTSPAPTVNRSSLYGNGNYAVYLYGAANSSAVLDFTENWWGTTNTTAINGSIRDHYDDPNAAYIDYIPFLASAGGDPVTDSFVGGPILTSTTWGVSGSPFTVYQSVTVPSGVTLTIEPGVVVRFAGPYGIAVTGILGARGTAGNPISFTSGQASPSPGNWTSIRLSGAESSASQLSHCTIGYADSGLILDSSSATVSYVTSSNNGSNGFVVTNANPTLTGITASSNPTGLYLQSSSPTITQATLSSNFYGAYLLYGSSPTISFSSIVNNSSMGIIVDPGGTSPAPTVNRSSLYGNGNYAVYLYGAANSSAVLDFTENWWGTTNTTAINGSIRDHYDDPNAAYIDYIPFLASAGGDPVTDSFVGGPILTSTTWGVSGSPFTVYQSVTVPSGVTLTIEPGVVVRFAGPYGIAVTGILGAQGTAGNPISFTSGQASPSPGNWTSIRLSGAESSASQLSHCTIGYADSGLILDSSSATVSYVTSSNNGSNGFVVTNANPTLTGITASSNPTGLYLQSSSPTITQATLSSNFYGAYLLYGSSPTISFSSIVNNSSMGIIVDPGGTSPAPTVNRSSLYGNGNYAVYLYGAANSSAVLDFTENWWGTTNTTAINGSIRDHYDDPNAAYIDYIPFAADGSICHPAPMGVVSWWPGDSTADDLASTNDGTPMNGIGFCAGRVGTAFCLDGVDDYVEFGDLPSLQLPSLTLSAWVKRTGPATGTWPDLQIIVGRAGLTGLPSTDGAYLRWFEGNANFVIVDSAGSVLDLRGTTPLQDGEWYLITGTFDAATRATRLYVNGFLDAQGATTSDLPANTVPWRIGASSSGLETFHGSIDEVQVFGRALAPSEVSAIFAADSAGLCKCIDTDGDGYGVGGGVDCPTSTEEDCNDAESATNPGAIDSDCDNVDENCTGQPDEGYVPVPTGCGVGACTAVGQTYCQGGAVLSACTPGVPSAETCNAIDDNCNALVDEDALGEDTDADGIHNLCDNCRQLVNPTQLDTDHDAVGNSCDNCTLASNPGQQDTDLDARGDACDNCRLDYNPFQDDYDADRAGDACDNCLFDYNPAQTDLDHDVEGDLCDLNDGVIYILFHQPDYVEWQEETGLTTWNSYRGDLQVLRAGGPYTQLPGSNSLASRHCGLTDPWALDEADPLPGQAAFFLTTGVFGGESGLGKNSSGVVRPNANPCP